MLAGTMIRAGRVASLAFSAVSLLGLPHAAQAQSNAHIRTTAGTEITTAGEVRITLGVLVPAARTDAGVSFALSVRRDGTAIVEVPGFVRTAPLQPTAWRFDDARYHASGTTVDSETLTISLDRLHPPDRIACSVMLLLYN
jgi:hypothetical protein